MNHIDLVDLRRTRRARLLERVNAPILLMGNGEQPRNLPLNVHPFRQDSTFLYFVGLARPGAAALLHEDGRMDLYLPTPPEDDALWHGPGPTPDDIGASVGANAVHDPSVLADHARVCSPKTLAVSDPARNQIASAITGMPLSFAREYGDDALVDAVIELRRVKDDWELGQMRRSAALTTAAFRHTMAATHSGGTERALWALFEGTLRANGATTAYDTILSQSGEILHTRDHSQPLTDGRMVLLDGGAEVETGYASDVTRTWPVNGRFGPRQRAAYQAVLEAQRASIALCRKGVAYRDVHDASSRVIAQFLIDEKLAHGTADGLVEQHAHALFFPHGVGHHLGLDVHDLENFGDRPSYPRGLARPDAFGTRNLRLQLPLETGWIVTVEPGFYVVPDILSNSALRERFGNTIDFAQAEAWLGFGGIRIEDDVVVTADGPEVLTQAIPKEIGDVEDIVGSMPSAVRLFSV